MAAMEPMVPTAKAETVKQQNGDVEGFEITVLSFWNLILRL